MAKLKNLVIEPAKNAALQWHFGIVTEPPSDRAGKEYLAQHLPKHYQLEGDILIVKSTGLRAVPKELAVNQANAKSNLHSASINFARQEEKASKQALQALQDRPKEARPVEGLWPSSLSPRLQSGSTSYAVTSSAPQPVVNLPDEGFSRRLEQRFTPYAGASSAPQPLFTVPDKQLATDGSGLIEEDPWACEHSSSRGYSSFAVDDSPAAFDYQVAFLSESGSKSNANQPLDNSSGEAARTAPLFSGKVLNGSQSGTYNQYGLLFKAVALRQSQHLPELTTPKLPWVFDYDPRIFLNVNAPWSTFICGSQGSGKSYTLSCMLENCLIPSELGQLPSPLAAIVFHYDTFTSYGSRQLCEAAYLCSAGVPVKVLVSPTNFWRMRQTYENLPLSSPTSRKPEVVPMKFHDKHLDVTRMMNLMAVSDKNGPVPLYIEVIFRILREMAVESQGAPGLDYNAFRKRIDGEAFTGQQTAPLKLRLELLESFMDRPSKTEEEHQAPNFPDTGDGRQASNNSLAQKARERSIEKMSADRVWDFEPGTLTIVDLSCPFVDESSACALFSICLDLFLESRNTASRIVALDEAHKFMTSTAAATTFTDKLLQLIRQQRHLATRVVISTQEPTISPRLLDLCTVTIVHRFTSPQWFRTLRSHLAGVSTAEELGGAMKRDARSIFAEIVELEPGEALIFSPSAVLEPVEGEAPRKLGMEWLKVRVRKRLTEDGGRSILAT